MEHAVQPFIDRWSKSAGAERANYQLFLAELCDVLGVARPEPTGDDDAHNQRACVKQLIRCTDFVRSWLLGKVKL